MRSTNHVSSAEHTTSFSSLSFSFAVVVFALSSLLLFTSVPLCAGVAGTGVEGTLDAREEFVSAFPPPAAVVDSLALRFSPAEPPADVLLLDWAACAAATAAAFLASCCLLNNARKHKPVFDRELL